MTDKPVDGSIFMFFLPIIVFAVLLAIGVSTVFVMRRFYRNARLAAAEVVEANNNIEQKAVQRIAALPVIVWDSAAPLEDVDDSCSLCLEAYTHGDKLKQLPCKHIYHQRCIDVWLCEKQRSKLRSCPMCKRDPSAPPRPPTSPQVEVEISMPSSSAEC